MTAAFAVFLVGHGLLHLIGVAKGFRLAALPQLTQPITPLAGALWLAAAVLLVVSAGAIYVWPRWWWGLAVVAAGISTAAIVPSWADAKMGAAANLVVLAGALFGYLSQGPGSLRASYEDDVARASVMETAGGAAAGGRSREASGTRAALSARDWRRRAAARRQLPGTGAADGFAADGTPGGCRWPSSSTTSSPAGWRATSTSADR